MNFKYLKWNLLVNTEEKNICLSVRNTWCYKTVTVVRKMGQSSEAKLRLIDLKDTPSTPFCTLLVMSLPWGFSSLRSSQWSHGISLNSHLRTTAAQKTKCRTMHRDTSDLAGFRRKVFPSQEPTASKYKNKDTALIHRLTCNSLSLRL